MITVTVFGKPMLRILSTHNSSNTSVSFRVDFSLFLVQIIKTNCIFLEEESVCVSVCLLRLNPLLGLFLSLSSLLHEGLSLSLSFSGLQ